MTIPQVPLTTFESVEESMRFADEWTQIIARHMLDDPIVNVQLVFSKRMGFPWGYCDYINKKIMCKKYMVKLNLNTPIWWRFFITHECAHLPNETKETRDIKLGGTGKWYDFAGNRIYTEEQNYYHGPKFKDLCAKYGSTSGDKGLSIIYIDYNGKRKRT